MPLTHQQCTQLVAALIGAIGLQQIMAPHLQWSLKFYPEGTPAGHEQWIHTLRAFGFGLLGWSLTMLNMQGLGMAICGAGWLVGGFVYNKFAICPPMLVGAIVMLMGICNIACNGCCCCSSDANKAGSRSVTPASPAPKKRTASKKRK